MISVDLASVDRRTIASEYETSARVRSLVEKFSMSEIRNETNQNVLEETTKPPIRRTVIHFYEPRAIRILWVLIT